MSNIDTLKAVTENLQAVLQKLGLKFDQAAYDDIVNIPSGSLPHGDIFFDGLRYGRNFSEAPLYAEVQFRVRVVQAHNDPIKAQLDQQLWMSNVRGAVTVAALNTGALAGSKLVSEVIHEPTPPPDNRPTNISAIEHPLSIRFREM